MGVKITESEMTTGITPPAAPVVRTNRSDDPCPPWCVTDHDEILMTLSSGRVVHNGAHRSDPIASRFPAPEVRVTKRRDGTWVSLNARGAYLSGPEALSSAQADRLAALLEVLGADDGGRLSDDLRAAAAIARDSE